MESFCCFSLFLLFLSLYSFVVCQLPFRNELAFCSGSLFAALSLSWLERSVSPRTAVIEPCSHDRFRRCKQCAHGHSKRYLPSVPGATLRRRSHRVAVEPQKLFVSTPFCNCFMYICFDSNGKLFCSLGAVGLSAVCLYRSGKSFVQLCKTTYRSRVRSPEGAAILQATFAAAHFSLPRLAVFLLFPEAINEAGFDILDSPVPF